MDSGRQDLTRRPRRRLPEGEPDDPRPSTGCAPVCRSVGTCFLQRLRKPALPPLTVVLRTRVASQQAARILATGTVASSGRVTAPLLRRYLAARLAGARRAPLGVRGLERGRVNRHSVILNFPKEAPVRALDSGPRGGRPGDGALLPHQGGSPRRPGDFCREVSLSDAAQPKLHRRSRDRHQGLQVCASDIAAPASALAG